MIENRITSLEEMLGAPYIRAVCAAGAALGIGGYEELLKIAREKVEFFPEDFRRGQEELRKKRGERVIEPFKGSCPGAGTYSFQKALDLNSAPLSGRGCYRLGEDGRVHFIGKSEHYQASLGHHFPGFRLLENAMRIGITNITHNNTRGHVTRLLEQELVRVANGLAKGDRTGLQAVLDSREPHVLNRVINLETGSLVCEAALKMMLARFYRLQTASGAPKYAGRTPVFLVMAAQDGSCEANYHGTNIVNQMLRGMWPDLYAGMERAGLLRVVPVAIDDERTFRQAVEQYDTGSCKVAGFFHELVLMNYGGVKLSPAYVQACHAICHERDIPVMVDEIQSCMWSPEIFLFREYGCRPDFVSVGKGFPAGMYPASRILTTEPMDNLNQFGALVTNGQEELASLANLITIEFAEANRAHTAAIGALWEETLRGLAARHADRIEKAEGHGLLGALRFRDPQEALDFSHTLSRDCAIDVSVQAYKTNCPPAVLTKPPLIADEATIRDIGAVMEKVLGAMAGAK